MLRVVLAVAAAVCFAAACTDGGDIRLPDPAPSLVDDSVPRIGDHIHIAFGVYVCDRFLPPLPTFESALGIHTHGDSIIHVHPFTREATGSNARLLLFLEGAGVAVAPSRQSLTVDGTTYAAGDDCRGAPVNALTVTWSGGVPKRTVRRIDDVRLDTNGDSIVIAFVPEGANVPLPP
jgi:hypothetical protein